MPKPFLLLKTLLIANLLLVSGLPLANSDNTQRADEIFSLIDNGIAINEHERYLALIDELDSVVAENDTWRQLRKARARCWSFDIFKEGEVDKALTFVEHALTHPLLSQYPSHKLDLALCQSFYTEQDGDVDLALKGYNKAINDAYALEDLRLVADARSIRGYLHSYQGNFTLALEDLISAKSLYQNLNLSDWARLNLYEIANSYRRFGDQKSAIRYFKQLEMDRLKNNHFDAATNISTSIAIAEEELGNLNEAKSRFEKSYQYWRTKGNEVAQATVGVNIARTLIQLGELEQAKQYLDLAKPFIQASDEAFYGFMHLFYGQTYLAEGQFEQALESLSLAQNAFVRVKNMKGLAEQLKIKSDVFVQQGDWQQAYESLNAYVQQHNELDTQLLSTYTTEMRTRFNADQMEEENRHLMKNQQLREIELAILEQNKLQQWIIILLGGLITIIISVFAYKQKQKNKLLSALALTDDLTQLPNRRDIYRKAEEQFEQAMKQQTPLSVITFDADYFKQINDNFGHEVGDDSLKLLANICRSVLGSKYEAARTGGEEFLILLPNTDKDNAFEIAQNLVNKVRTADLSNYPQQFSITISAGVACITRTDEKLSQLLKRADDALYLAKKEGRDQSRML
ncbi:GGDEF domain-containing protein [Shewanella sairae]|uniref:diguanylate cyclase n=1 Tax=Shewanella sairae TaxID=190310 RepID=A0ABQ4P1F0_9GAMM|nr:diguanylate cyclase [Shewanella sairae]MCL1129720.1 diguanylate cyclase [Shewanella sairae]GIU41350.1 GGDEF domain-containing protein [Shewanella sairae]